MNNAVVTVHYNPDQPPYRARVLSGAYVWDQWMLLVWDIESECLRTVSSHLVDEWEGPHHTPPYER